MAQFSQDQINSPYAYEQTDDPLAWQYLQDFSGGEDSFRRSTLIDPNQCQHLLNVLVRDNYEARTRFGADSIPVVNQSVQTSVQTSSTFLINTKSMVVGSATGIAVGDVITGHGIAPGTVVTSVAGTTIGFSIFSTAASAGNYTFVFTGATAIRALRYFDTPAYEQLLASVDANGTPKFLKFEAGGWVDLSALWAPAASDDRLAMAQGVDTMLISDGSGVPQIYSGAAFTATGTGTAANDAPLGCTILCWHTFRMLASGVAGFYDTVWVSEFLDYTDGHWSTANRSFRVGAGDGDPIVAIASMQSTTAAVLKRNSIWLLTMDPTQDTGIAMNTYAQTAAIVNNIAYGLGCVGRDAWAAYGNDVLFMSQDGVRSVQRMQAAAGQWQLTAPLSQPIQPYIQRINQAAWQNIVAKSYLEFVFFFVPLDNSLTNNYVLVYNARLQKWLGAWTNWNGLCVETTRFNGTFHFVFGDTTGKVNQWKDLASNTDDGTYLDNLVGYPTQIWTASWQFTEPITGKTGYNLITRFTAGNAIVTFQWVCDLVALSTFTGTFAPTGDTLAVTPSDTTGGTFPFLLEYDAPSFLSTGIRGLAEFNEAYLSIETKTGWIWLRNVAASAFINALREDYG